MSISVVERRDGILMESTMNKSEIIAKVSEETGVPAEVCEKVVKSLERVLQDELRAKDGLGLLGKITGALRALTPESER